MLSPQKKADYLRSLTPHQLMSSLHDWPHWARHDQTPPDHDWLIWLLLGGRGAGKTRTGAEWIRAQVLRGARHIALVAPSYNDAREVMLEGESGLLSIGFPYERPSYIASRRRLEWPCGAIGHIYSSEDPDGLRGPQFDAAWADEFCAWSYPEETLSNLRMALRLGLDPQLVITTTPRPIKALTRLMTMSGVHVSKATTFDNRAHLSDSFLSAMEDTYAGTRLGRQELMGEVMTDHPGALWSREMIDHARVKTAPALSKIIIAIDPPVTSGVRADSCGLVVVGLAGEGRAARAYVLQDATVQGLRPEQWAQRALALWESWDADYLLAEVNQGGELVRSVLSAVNPQAPIRTVYASIGKTARAEPVAALYEQGRIHHVGCLDQLEDELCQMGAFLPGGRSSKSPDRADALVWAINELLLRPRVTPQLRSL